MNEKSVSKLIRDLFRYSLWLACTECINSDRYWDMKGLATTVDILGVKLKFLVAISNIHLTLFATL